MSPHRLVSNRFTLAIILLILLAACGLAQPTSELPSVPSTIPAALPSPTIDTGGLAPDAATTLLSLEKLDDYPFYVMQFVGDYEYPVLGTQFPAVTGFGCSLFAALGGDGDKFFGRNFDWELSPALLLFTDPADGFASVSMVDLTFLGIDSQVANSLTEQPLVMRTDLLTAPALPFDGMNEYGLVIAMAAVPEEYRNDTSDNTSLPTIGSIGIIRQVLDHARNVDDALDIFTQYNIEFAGGPPIHYLFADPSGKAILVEFYQKELVPLPNTDPWHLATNHLRCTAEGDGGCWRYRTLSNRLEAVDGKLDLSSAMQLLSDVKQSSTQWSAVYNMVSGDVNVAIGQNYDSPYTFHLDLKLPCRTCP